MPDPGWLQELLAAVLATVIAITLHEAAHGYAALGLGDPTAREAGRLSLNPLRHVDRVGTVLVPGVLLLGQLLTIGRVEFMFGWAKPVPVNFGQLRNPRVHSIWVAGAGPGINVVQALAWALVAKILALTVAPTGLAGGFWLAVAEAGVVVNVIFAILNLFPLLPLDGGRILSSLLPPRVAYTYAKTEPFGMIILIVLVVSGALSWLLGPLVSASLASLYSLFGLR